MVRLPGIVGRTGLRVAVGLAIPSIEAWYLCGSDHQVNEAAWNMALESGHFRYDNQRLKQSVYGTVHPSLEAARQMAVDKSRRLVEGDGLHRLEELFPIGFGSLAEEVRRWRS
jgi:hypothetical protein